MKRRTETLASIRAAYQSAPKRWQGKLPEWDDLSSALRMAFIQVYHQGRRDVLEDLDATRQRARKVAAKAVKKKYRQ